MTPTRIRTVWFQGWDRAAETDFWDYHCEVHWPDGTVTETHTLRPEWRNVPMRILTDLWAVAVLVIWFSTGPL